MNLLEQFTFKIMAKKGFTLKGMNKVTAELNKHIKQMPGNVTQGLIEGAIHIRRSMDKEEPKIPVDTNNLRSSFFVVTRKGTTRGQGATFKGENAPEMASQHSSVITAHKSEVTTSLRPLLIMGFSANYAFWVHSMYGPSPSGNPINWNRKGSGPEFFEKHLTKERLAVLKIIKKEASL